MSQQYDEWKYSKQATARGTFTVDKKTKKPVSAVNLIVHVKGATDAGYGVVLTYPEARDLIDELNAVMGRK